jgi:hypothetical protein
MNLMPSRGKDTFVFSGYVNEGRGGVHGMGGDAGSGGRLPPAPRMGGTLCLHMTTCHMPLARSFCGPQRVHDVRTESTRVVVLRQDGVRSGRIIVVVLIYYYYKRSHILCNRLGYPLDERRYDPCCDPIGYLVLAHADRCLWHFVGFQRGARPRLNCLRLLANLPPLPHKMSCRPLVLAV